VGYSCPDFNEPSFETLTITRMLGQTASAIDAAPAGPIALIGSSLGAFVAVHAAAADRARRIDRLVLLAPALDFGGNRLRQMGQHGIDEWRRLGKVPFFHYAFNEPREVGFGLYEDAARYDALTIDVTVPALVFQGRRDELVDHRMVEQWAQSRPNVDLRLLDDDHQLLASMDRIWAETVAFLAIARTDQESHEAW